MTGVDTAAVAVSEAQANVQRNPHLQPWLCVRPVPAQGTAKGERLAQLAARRAQRQSAPHTCTPGCACGRCQHMAKVRVPP